MLKYDIMLSADREKLMRKVFRNWVTAIVTLVVGYLIVTNQFPHQQNLYTMSHEDALGYLLGSMVAFGIGAFIISAIIAQRLFKPSKASRSPNAHNYPKGHRGGKPKKKEHWLIRLLKAIFLPSKPRQEPRDGRVVYNVTNHHHHGERRDRPRLRVVK
jgi:hypothetical protein